MEQAVASLMTQEVLQEAARRFSTHPDDLTLLGDFENYVYSFCKNGRERVLRLTHSAHRSVDQVEAELEWVGFLAGEGARVARPHQSEAGKLVEQLEVTGSAFYASSFEKAPGEAVNHDNMGVVWHEGLFKEWGRTVGQMHRLTKVYHPREGGPRRAQWYEDEVLDAAKYLPASEAVAVARCRGLVAEAKALPTSRDSYGLIHTDVHPGNFFVHQGRLTVFDFDDASYNYFASDIATALYYALWKVREDETGEAFAQRFMRAFLSGYGQENTLEPRRIGQLVTLLTQMDPLSWNNEVITGVPKLAFGPQKQGEPRMRYHPKTLGEARLVARTLDYETKYGDLGVARCPSCHEATFALESRSDDGALDFGYCLNPDCRYEPAGGVTHPGPLERRVTGGSWL